MYNDPNPLALDIQRGPNIKKKETWRIYTFCGNTQGTIVFAVFENPNPQ